MKLPTLCSNCNIEFLADEEAEPLCENCRSDGEFLDKLI